MDITPAQARQAMTEADELYSAAAVNQALDIMAQQITAKLGDKNP